MPEAVPTAESVGAKAIRRTIAPPCGVPRPAPPAPADDAELRARGWVPLMEDCGSLRTYTYRPRPKPPKV